MYMILGEILKWKSCATRRAGGSDSHRCFPNEDGFIDEMADNRLKMDSRNYTFIELKSPLYCKPINWFIS